MTTKTALITGASRGLGLALATALAKEGWRLIISARGASDLSSAAQDLGATGLAGDIADSRHRAALIGAVEEAGGLDLLVNNASVLGALPLQPLDAYPIDRLEHAFKVNTLAPLALIQGLLPLLRERGGAILNISSDAAVEAYETWGGYGASKAALDQLSNVLAAEEPALSVWWVDPGEMRTRMLAEAMPGEDLSETPPPEQAAAALLRLLESRAPSGRYRAADL
ncbi:MAG: short-chain dehydrogenase/reductase [Streptosporangiaceae bacterium]|jgi:NAD(P)-dependent dehydrogenase (short-subunit alcohol dehydrogenase family)|nr:short-chain dehydrogenase/reductase [Streptosporangiaceae bacterium]